MSIPISEAKRVLNDNDMAHVVIFAVSADGQQHVATFGKTRANARQAAEAGNKLKAALGWPGNLCNSVPLERICKNCDFYKPDYGMWCFNGWSGDSSVGICLQLPVKTNRNADDRACSFMEPRGDNR